MKHVTLYHYVTDKKYRNIIDKKLLNPSFPFNSRIPENEWENYVCSFPFPVARLNTCCFFEPNPKNWKEYGLFDLLMEEFAGGDQLLELKILDEDLDGEFDETTVRQIKSPVIKNPILVRDHSFHSPKNYEMLPSEWSKRERRDSRPDLREAWYRSTTPLKSYDGSFICPEVLIPFSISLDKIRVIKK